jgi:hypothetical protein
MQIMITMHMLKARFLWVLLLPLGLSSQAQDLVVTEKGDTINRFNAKGLREGPWVIQVEPLRGQPGYEEEGVFREGKKEGAWRRFSLQGDLIAVENFKGGFRDGKQMYFTRLGEPLREESWKAVDPTNPYDTIEVPDLDNPLISHTKVIRLESDEVRHGTWTYFDPMTGAVVRRETFISGQKLTMPDGRNPIPAATGASSQSQTPAEKAKPKPKAVEEWEKKNNGKKRVTVRDGSTGGG